MSKIKMNLPFPLDDDRFFRRECPLCCKEFKVLLEEEELNDLAREGIDSYMLESQEELPASDEKDTEPEFTCPYCGQQSAKDTWWTQEQLAYLGVVVNNIMAEMVNEQLVRPLKRMSRRYSSGPVKMQFQGKEMKQQEPWISPETNDMEVFPLPCCNRSIKIDESWNSEVYCFFCGFPHRP